MTLAARSFHLFSQPSAELLHCKTLSGGTQPSFVKLPHLGFVASPTLKITFFKTYRKNTRPLMHVIGRVYTTAHAGLEGEHWVGLEPFDKGDLEIKEVA